MFRKKSSKKQSNVCKKLRKTKINRNSAWRKFVKLDKKSDEIKKESEDLFKEYESFLDKFSEAEKDISCEISDIEYAINMLSTFKDCIESKADEIGDYYAETIAEEIQCAIDNIKSEYEYDIDHMNISLDDYANEKIKLEEKISKLEIERIEVDRKRDYWKNVFESDSKSYSKFYSIIKKINPKIKVSKL